MKNIHGVITATLTPFDEKGDLKEGILRSYIRHNIDTMNVDGLYVGGSTGEYLLCSTEERIKVLEIAAKENNGAIAAVAHVGSLNIREAIELGLVAKKLGYDAISAVSPFYYGFGFEGIRTYYERIIEATDMPMMIYYIPILTNVKLNIDEFSKLYENQKIIGVKYTAIDFYLMERIKTAFPNRGIWFGSDDQIMASVPYKVEGVIGSTYNVLGHLAKSLFKEVENGNIDKATGIQTHINNIIDVIAKNGVYPAMKYMLFLYGLEEAYSREPFKKLSGSEKSVIKEAFDKYLK